MNFNGEVINIDIRYWQFINRGSISVFASLKGEKKANES